MSKQKDRSLKLTPDWRATVLVAVLLPLLLSLGFWQLDRAAEKRQLQALNQQRQHGGAIEIEQILNKVDVQYQPVTMRGHYLNDKAILLDNRIFHGRFGYEIITPFQLSSNGYIVMVNRGWLAADSARRSLPAIQAISGEVELSAEVYVPHGEMMVLGAEAVSQWPRIVQSININQLATEFDQPIYPYTVRLAEHSLGSYQANWMIVNLQPSKHIAYAVQWFAMSFTLVLIALLVNTNIWAWLKTKATNS